MNVKEAAMRAAVSVRALRYYEEIGLLCPGRGPENNYREYTEEDIHRARLIHAYRELGFSLDQVGILLSAPRMERDGMLSARIDAMEEKCRQLKNRIDLARSIRAIGPERLTELDWSTIDEQMNRAQQYITQNPEMQQLSERMKKHSAQQAEEISEELIRQLAKIANAEESAVDNEIAGLQSFIEQHFYPCTDAILLYYARAFGGDGLLAQTLEETGGENSAIRLRQRLEHWLRTH